METSTTVLVLWYLQQNWACVSIVIYFSFLKVNSVNPNWVKVKHSLFFNQICVLWPHVLWKIRIILIPSITPLNLSAKFWNTVYKWEWSSINREFVPSQWLNERNSSHERMQSVLWVYHTYEKSTGWISEQFCIDECWTEIRRTSLFGLFFIFLKWRAFLWLKLFSRKCFGKNLVWHLSKNIQVSCKTCNMMLHKSVIGLLCKVEWKIMKWRNIRTYIMKILMKT